MPSRKPLTPPEKLLEKKTGLKLGKRIYHVYDCAVYAIHGQPNRLVKLVSPDEACDVRGRMKCLKNIVKQNNPGVVKVFQLGSFTIRSGEFEGQHYFYVMRRLKPLKIKSKAIIIDRLAEAIENHTRPTITIPRKLLDLVEQVKPLKLAYWDMHSGNIMQDSSGKCKFIDLEGFLPEEYD